MDVVEVVDRAALVKTFIKGVDEMKVVGKGVDRKAGITKMEPTINGCGRMQPGNR